MDIELIWQIRLMNEVGGMHPVANPRQRIIQLVKAFSVLESQIDILSTGLFNKSFVEFI